MLEMTQKRFIRDRILQAKFQAEAANRILAETTFLLPFQVSDEQTKLRMDITDAGQNLAATQTMIEKLVQRLR